MGYSVRKVEDEEAWEIIDEEGDVKAKYTDQGKAERIVTVLGKIESKWGDD